MFRNACAAMIFAMHDNYCWRWMLRNQSGIVKRKFSDKTAQERFVHRTTSRVAHLRSPEVIAPLIKEQIIPFQLEHRLDVVLAHSTSWDVLGALMENSYLDTHHPAHFFLELLWVYEAGHFPCGWLGDWPSGKLFVL